jgi:DNA (cytosine-5)-methyltransferase 1
MGNSKRTIKAADLFCGAGGSSTGLRQACEALGLPLNLIAVNHWDIAISTHTANHPEADHLCTDLNSVDPRKIVPGGRLDLLIASPECTHHSIARGGKPINDQSRASAWRITEWASQITIDHILIENVKEFRTWGPLGTNGRPLKRRKGETYLAFLNSLRSLGYNVEDRVLNAADFGDPTSRERLFIQAKRGRSPIVWPEATHGKARVSNNRTLFETGPTLRPYRTAREIIDWSIAGESIYTRKKPLKPNTLARIYKGLQKFAGLPFVVNSGGREIAPRCVDDSLNTVVTRDHLGVCQPFLVKYYGGADGQSIDEPIPAITANYEHYGLCEPFIVVLRNNMDARSVNDPLATIAAGGTHQGLCQPFLVRYNGSHKDRNDGDSRVESVDEPVSTLDTSNRLGVVQPFIIPNFGEREGQEPRTHSIDSPLPTVTSHGAGALVQPFIIPLNHGKADHRSHSINRPMPVITTLDAWGIVEPFLVKYNKTGGAMSVDHPLDTVTAKDRFALIEPYLKDGEYAVLDIRFRMLQPHELAAAMSFPKTYVFTGNREQKVKQIGNAVPVGMAAALCRSILSSRAGVADRETLEEAA